MQRPIDPFSVFDFILGGGRRWRGKGGGGGTKPARDDGSGDWLRGLISSLFLSPSLQEGGNREKKDEGEESSQGKETEALTPFFTCQLVFSVYMVIRFSLKCVHAAYKRFRAPPACCKVKSRKLREDCEYLTRRWLRPHSLLLKSRQMRWRLQAVW